MYARDDIYKILSRKTEKHQYSSKRLVKVGIMWILPSDDVFAFCKL